MKTSFLLGIFVLLTGCTLSTSSELKIAEEFVSQFECKNVDNEQLTHNPITGFHQRSLSVSKDKALDYIESYKSGDGPIEMPLDQLIEQQYMTYKSACEFLGGVTAEQVPLD